MAPIKVHGIVMSPPVRAVMLTCKALDIEYDFHLVNTIRGDHKTPEFLKMNPLHTVPVIEDGDFILFDSHAIAQYLADKVDSDRWYPKDPQRRATVDQRLHFDNAILFTRVRDILEPVLYFGEPAFRPESVKGLEEALVMLDTVLGDNDFVAGSTATIADCCCIASVSTMVNLVPRMAVPERVSAWMLRCEQALPAFKEINNHGAVTIGKFARSIWMRRFYGMYLGVEKRLTAALGCGRGAR